MTAVTVRFPTRTTPPPVIGLWRAKQRFIKGKSGWGGGKTYTLVHWAVKMAALNPGLRGILVEPTHGMVADILVPTIEEVCEKHGLNYRIEKSTGRYNWHLLDFGVVIYLRSGEKPNRLVGPTVAFAGIDEAGLQKFDVFRKVSSRVRDKRAAFLQVLCVGTPDEMNWFYSVWQEKTGDPDYAEFKWTTFDNAQNLAPGYIDDLRSNLDENHFRAYVLGEDVHLASGTVFSNFTDANITEGVEPAPPGDGLPSEPLIWTMDFNVNPMTAVMWVVRGDRAYARDEIVLRHSHVEETVREMQRRWPLDQWPGQTVIPDATGGGRNSLVGYTHHDALRLAGYKLKFRVLRREQDAINASRRMICDAAGVRRVFIDRRCVKLLHSVKVWAYERDSNKTREKEYADDERNYFVPHLADCFKYLFWNLFPISKPSWRI